MSILILSGTSNDHVDATVTATQVTAHIVDTAFNQGQAVVGLCESLVGVEADLDHPGLGVADQVINVVFATIRLEMTAVGLKHGRIGQIDRQQVDVGGQPLGCPDESLVDGRKLVVVPSWAWTTLRRRQEELK